MNLNNLRKLREQYGISQQKLAEYFHLSQQSIYKYENGLSEPDFQTLRELADFFNTSVDYLVDYTDDPTLSSALVHIEFMPAELNHLKMYRRVSPHFQKILDTMLMEVIEGNAVELPSSENVQKEE